LHLHSLPHRTHFISRSGVSSEGGPGIGLGRTRVLRSRTSPRPLRRCWCPY
jgi:hypothetical protein